MKRLVLLVLVLLIAGTAVFFANHYWVHRYDALIARQASVYRIDPDLVWSIINEETYFRPWKVGQDGEVGLMQIMPVVAREWAAETGMRELGRQIAENPAGYLRDPERNIQIGSWYLEKIREPYRDLPNAEARVLAAYNAGPSRAAEWSKPASGDTPLTESEFINRIDIPSTRAYVVSILERYRNLKGAAQINNSAAPTSSRKD